MLFSAQEGSPGYRQETQTFQERMWRFQCTEGGYREGFKLQVGSAAQRQVLDIFLALLGYKDVFWRQLHPNQVQVPGVEWQWRPMQEGDRLANWKWGYQQASSCLHCDLVFHIQPCRPQEACKSLNQSLPFVWKRKYTQATVNKSSITLGVYV